MGLEAILLGLVSTPQSGYDLKKEFENSLAHFWSVNLSQIYPTLKKMEIKGLVASRSSESHLGPSKVIYERTPEGRDALLRWLTSGPVFKAEKLHHLAQAYFLYELDNKKLASDFFEKLLAELKAWQVQMESIDSLWRGSYDETFFEALPKEDFYPYLTLDLGLRKNLTMIAWCQDCLRHISKRKE